jgi:predicted outer membrane lipoprotein
MGLFPFLLIGILLISISGLGAILGIILTSILSHSDELNLLGIAVFSIGSICLLVIGGIMFLILGLVMGLYISWILGLVMLVLALGVFLALFFDWVQNKPKKKTE